MNSFTNLYIMKITNSVIQICLLRGLLRRNIEGATVNTERMKMLLSIGLTFRNLGGLFGLCFQMVL